MLYIISFQSISCSEASPTSSRPHKGPPEGVSIGHPLNLPPGFPHVAQLCPLAGLSKQFSSRPERRSSPRPPCPQVPQGHSRVAKPSSIIPSPRTPYPQIPQCHPGVAKPSSIIPSPRPPCPQVLQCHPHVPNNHIISLKPASKRTSTGPRHGHPVHRYLSGIPTWQSRHLSSLRHGHPAHSYSSGIPTCRAIQQSLSNRPLTGPRPVLATATPPIGTSVPSRRGKAVIYHPFATATLPTDSPMASPRAEQSYNLSQTDL